MRTISNTSPNQQSILVSVCSLSYCSTLICIVQSFLNLNAGCHYKVMTDHPSKQLNERAAKPIEVSIKTCYCQLDSTSKKKRRQRRGGERTTRERKYE